MKRSSSLPLLLIAAPLVLFLAGCGGHEPLPTLRYAPSTPLGSQPQHLTRASLETGQAIGHSLTSYALLPGGYAMPITSGPSATGDFNEEDQAAFLQNLMRVLGDRGLIRLAGAGEQPAVTLTVKFLKTEHFPDMQDYVLDVLVIAHHGERTYERVHHVNTMDGVNLVARMFQNGIDGRRHAAELLLAAVVPDLERWFTAVDDAARAPAAGTLRIAQPFDACVTALADFLRARYARPSTFWKDGISVRGVRPSPRVASIELRWSNSDVLPPFCLVDIYADGDGTRVEIRERDALLSAKAHVAEAIKEYNAQLAQKVPAR